MPASTKLLAVILGGGAGNRLFPLTQQRSKPAVPLGGKYRLVDIALSNCINSDILRTFVLTQYNSASLNRHIAQTYRFSQFSNGFVEILAAEQTPESPQWFQGTADAVRQVLPHIRDWGIDTLLILSDRGVDKDYAPIPSLLALAAVHNLLVKEETRTQVALIIESGEPREVMHFALLIGYGASAINPYLAFETLENLAQTGYLPDGITPIPPTQTPLQRAMAGEAVATDILVRNSSLNHEVWLEVSSSPLRDKDGALRGGMIAFRDITERKANELEIRKLNEGLEERIATRTSQRLEWLVILLIGIEIVLSLYSRLFP